MFQTIVVATDGSDHAQKAVELAIDIAVKYDAKLILLNVIMRGGKLPDKLRSMIEEKHPEVIAAAVQSPAAAFPVLEGKMLSEHIDAVRHHFQAVGQSILNRGQQVARDKGVKEIHAKLRDGDPAKQILECVEHENADLIVMGSRGLGDLEGVFVGSVSHKVSHLAKCTCITVK